MTDLPDTHRQALGWLARSGGEAMIDRHGRLLAAGEHYRGTETAQVWLRLVTTGHVEPAGRGRLRLTPDGRAIGDRQPRPHLGRGPAPRSPHMIDDAPEDFA